MFYNCNYDLIVKLWLQTADVVNPASINESPHGVRFSAQRNKVPKINQLHLEILPFSIRKNNLRAAIGRLRIYDGLNGQRCTLRGRLATQKILGCITPQEHSGKKRIYRCLPWKLNNGTSGHEKHNWIIHLCIIN